MLVREAKELTGGGLGSPSKMPGTSYGISAHNCITGAKLALIDGSICHDCYALGARYNYPSVKTAHERREASLGSPQWPSAMAFLILRADVPEHRWFDSGDLQGEWHLKQIIVVCKLTPKVKHWLPTKETAMVVKFVKAGGEIPPNLCIRASAIMIDGPAPKSWPTTSGVHTSESLVPSGTHVCPAPRYNNTCGPCRACWSKEVPHVSYHKH